MDIKVEDNIVVRNLDVVAEAGGPFIAHVIDIPNVIVSNDVMTITFIPVKQFPMISGIEIFQSTILPDDTTTPSAVPTTYLATLAPMVTVTPVTPFPSVSPYNDTTTPTTSLESMAPMVTVAPVTNFPTASPLTLPPNSSPITMRTSSVFRDIFINCGGIVCQLYQSNHYNFTI